MPLGSFLNTLSPTFFICVHILFFLLGFWAVMKAKRDKRSFASLLMLYVLAQLVFIGYFAGVFNMKLAVLIEQILMVILVCGVATAKKHYS